MPRVLCNVAVELRRTCRVSRVLDQKFRSPVVVPVHENGGQVSSRIELADVGVWEFVPVLKYTRVPVQVFFQRPSDRHANSNPFFFQIFSAITQSSQNTPTNRCCCVNSQHTYILPTTVDNLTTRLVLESSTYSHNNNNNIPNHDLDSFRSIIDSISYHHHHLWQSVWCGGGGIIPSYRHHITRNINGASTRKTSRNGEIEKGTWFSCVSQTNNNNIECDDD